MSSLIPGAGVIGLTVLCCLVISGPPRAAADNRAVHSLDKSIERHQDRLRRLSRRERDLLARYGRLTGLLTRIKAEVESLDTRLIRLKKEIERRQVNALVSGKRLSEVKSRFARRLRAYYKFTKAGGLGFVLGSPLRGRVLGRDVYLRFVLDRDKQALDGFLARRSEFERFMAGLRRTRGTIDAALDRRRRELLKYRKFAAERRRVIGRLRGQKSAASNLVADLRLRRTLGKGASHQAPSRVMVSAPGSWRPSGPSILARRGRLPWPVDPGSILSTRRERIGGRRSQGLVLGVRPGTPVKSIFAGRVVFVGSLRGYGRMLIISHGHRVYSVLARLKGIRVKSGQVVAAGQTLGYSGPERAGGRDDLYFEIRRGPKKENPLAWVGRSGR